MRLPKKFQDYLSNKPESGMGYQKVSVVLKEDFGDVIKGLVVLNGEELIIPNDFINNILDISVE